MSLNQNTDTDWETAKTRRFVRILPQTVVVQIMNVSQIQDTECHIQWVGSAIIGPCQRRSNQFCQRDGPQFAEKSNSRQRKYLWEIETP